MTETPLNTTSDHPYGGVPLALQDGTFLLLQGPGTTRLKVDRVTTRLVIDQPNECKELDPDA